MPLFCYTAKNAPRDKYLLLETRNYLRNFHLLSLCLLRPLSCRFTLPLFLSFFLKNWQLSTSSDKSWQEHAEWAAVREAGRRIASFTQSTLRLAFTKHYSHFVQQRGGLHARQQQTLESGRSVCVWKHARDMQWTCTPGSTRAMFIACILHVVLYSACYSKLQNRCCSESWATLHTDELWQGFFSFFLRPLPALGTTWPYRLSQWWTRWAQVLTLVPFGV